MSRHRPLWNVEIWLTPDWQEVEIPPGINWVSTVDKGEAEFCFGLKDATAKAVPVVQKTLAKTFDASLVNKRYLYVRGKGRVVVEEVP